MKIKDSIYGEEEINEKILIELINSKPLQRLKKISQFGVPDEYYHKKNFSRYEHSIGVLILLRRLNANLEEQIAGLLHDVSHPAFSHVIDWVIGDPTKEDYQDKIHLKMISKSEIPVLLEKYGFNHSELSNLENFTLLDSKSPSLCVDRVEYTLREIKGEIDEETIKSILSSLTSFNGKLVFKDKDSAESFAKYYMHLQNDHWSSEQAKARYYILSEILRIALDKKIIFLEDLRLDDEEVINLLIKSKNPFILKRLKLLKKGFNVVESNQGIELKKKFRYVDPEILIENSIKRLSSISKDYYDFIEKEKLKSNPSKKIMILEK